MSDDPAGGGPFDDAFCVLPWNHLEVLPEGNAKICCVAKEAVRDGRTPLHVSFHSLEEIRRSRYMKSVRGALADGRRIPVCDYCWQQEKRGERSQRQLWNASYPEVVRAVRERVESGAGDPTEPLPLEYLQVNVGNKCNLACRMCNSSYSSRIEEDPVHSKWAPRQDREAGVSADRPDGAGTPPALRQGWRPGVAWFEQPVVEGDLMAAGASLRSLYITGGEPLFVPAFDRLLDAYAERGHAGQIALALNTNLFHNEARIDRALAAFGRFRHCHLAPSIDGHGAVYEYIRHPARWDVVDRNIRKVADAARANSRLTFGLTTVVQAYNVFNLVTLLQYADSLAIECVPHVLEGPYFLRPHVLPRELRLRAAAGLDAYAHSPSATETAGRNRHYAARIARLLEGAEDQPELQLRRRQFAEFTRDLDVARKQSLAAAVPELAALAGV